jgi:hypothetical protein
MFFIRASGSQLPVLAIGDVEILRGMAGIFDRADPVGALRMTANMTFSADS